MTTIDHIENQPAPLKWSNLEKQLIGWGVILLVSVCVTRGIAGPMIILATILCTCGASLLIYLPVAYLIGLSAEVLSRYCGCSTPKSELVFIAIFVLLSCALGGSSMFWEFIFSANVMRVVVITAIAAFFLYCVFAIVQESDNSKQKTTTSSTTPHTSHSNSQKALVNYIKDCRRRGFPIEAVVSGLRNNHWTDAEIEAACRSAEANQSTAPGKREVC